MRSVVQAKGGWFNMVNVWKTPIFDRTQEDVDFAIRKISEWIVYNISSAEYDEKVRVENEELIIREGYATTSQDALVLQGDGRVFVENDALVVKIGVVYDLKGCLNQSDINRIEGNIAYLAEQLSSLDYPVSIPTKQWSKDDLPNGLDIQRIIDNIRSLVNAFYQPNDAPDLPTTMLSYNDINSIEKNIDLIKYLLDCMVSSFKKSGAFKSGSTIFLPTRR